MGQQAGCLSLAETVAKALSERGAGVLARADALRGYVTDYMDPGSAELRVLKRNCDEGLLRPYRDAVAGPSDLGAAASRAEEYLTSQCRIGTADARLVARGIVDGIALWAGAAPFRGPGPDSIRRETQAPVPDGTMDGASARRGGASARGNDGNSQMQDRGSGRQSSQKKGPAKPLVAALACAALALVLVVYLGRAGGSSANSRVVQVPVSEDVAESGVDSSEGDVIEGESDSDAGEAGQEDEGASADEVAEAEARSGVVADPRVVEDSSMTAGQKTTWDCVWLGSYPQAFVTDASTVAALDEATGWSASGDLAYGGATYRRLREADATYSGTSSNRWDWGRASPAGYCYFKWEPVKWRVLEADGSTALVVADVALDDQRYHATDTDVTWETCGLRAWLGTFRDDALTTAQQGAVVPQTLANDDNIDYDTLDGSATTDDVYLLAESDIWSTDKAARHGFVRAADTYDEARRCKPSDYAHAMGAYVYSDGSYDGNCWWWLRSPSQDAHCAADVRYYGNVSRSGCSVDYVGFAVRPAMRISLSSDQISYAGTVCSDGTSDEVAPGANKE